MQTTLTLRVDTEYKVEFPPEVAARLRPDELHGLRGILVHPVLGGVPVEIIAKPAAAPKAEAPAAPSAEPEALGRDVSGAALDAAIKPAADVPAAPSAPPEPKAERPSPPTERCSCRLTVPSGLPRAHSTRCPDYTPEDAEWARQHWRPCNTRQVKGELLVAEAPAAPVISCGSRVRLHPTGQAMTVVHLMEEETEAVLKLRLTSEFE